MNTERILQVAGRLLKVATLAGLSDKFGFGYVDPPPVDESQGERPTQQRVRFLQSFGFRSTPVVKGGQVLVAAPRGGATNAIAIAADNLNHGRTNLTEGETQVYSAVPGAEVFLAGSGQLAVNSGTPKGGTQADVVVNGGTHAVSRVGDRARGFLRARYVPTSVAPPVGVVTLSILNGASETILLQATLAGAVAIPAPGVPLDVEIDSALFEGADHFKA